MRRFFLNQALMPVMTITGSDVHHIKDILRMSSGDKIIVTAPDGSAAVARIENINSDKITLAREQFLTEVRESNIAVTLVQGLPKSDKMDYIVQKAVELGVAKIIPFAADNCVVRYDAAKQKNRRERWQKIASEAAKQCGRSLIPKVDDIRKLDDIMSELDTDTVVILLYEKQSTSAGLKKVLEGCAATSYAVIVGPEGGISPRELDIARGHGAHVVSLGPRILRTETAGVAAISVLQYHHGDLGS